MKASIRQILRGNSQPLDPRPTGQPAILRVLKDIQAVLFDVYGTLLVSASGESGPSTSRYHAQAFAEAIAAAGLEWTPECDVARLGYDGIHCLESTIEQQHTEARNQGVDWPEVEIRDTWRRVLQTLIVQQVLPPSAAELDVAQLAAHYEVRANPCWPMAHATDCIARLRGRGLSLGIVSNAQFYTRELLVALFDQPLDVLGFDPELQFFSYQVGQAKPGRRMMELAGEVLAGRAIQPRQVLYVGNDRRNDILPARQAGFRTALFAGDARSFRSRDEDPDLDGIHPDVLVTDLRMLCDCVQA
jgi:putative hydrolase of the HAD superfamily